MHKIPQSPKKKTKGKVQSGSESYIEVELHRKYDTDAACTSKISPKRNPLNDTTCAGLLCSASSFRGIRL